MNIKPKGQYLLLANSEEDTCRVEHGTFRVQSRTDNYSKLTLGGSASIVSDYGLDDRATGVRSPGEANDFSYGLCVQTSSEAHPASCPMGIGCHFPGGDKARPGRDADHSPSSIAAVKND
jgi:hypothetical protein